MKRYIFEVILDVPNGADVDQAREEIVGAIEDARDSDELGGCEVSWTDLEEQDEE